MTNAYLVYLNDDYGQPFLFSKEEDAQRFLWDEFINTTYGTLDEELDEDCVSDCEEVWETLMDDSSIEGIGYVDEVRLRGDYMREWQPLPEWHEIKERNKNKNEGG